MRLLITGSRGFVGGSVGRFAARAGHVVLGVGRASSPASSWPGRYMQSDVAISDLSVAIREFEPDVIFHCAGTASVGDSLRAPLDDFRAAAMTWANMLDSVRCSGLNPLILFPSSAAVYGNPARLPINEEMTLAPISPYGFHKAACELIAREYAQCFGLRIIGCRLFSIFGEAQRRLLVWELYRQFAGPESTIWLEGTGAESRDYLHIDDVSAALLQLVENRAPEFATGQPLFINVASGIETRVLELAAQLRDLVAPDKVIKCRGQERTGDPLHWRADISRLQALIPSWQPASLADALARCNATWQKEQRGSRHVG